MTMGVGLSLLVNGRLTSWTFTFRSTQSKDTENVSLVLKPASQCVCLQQFYPKRCRSDMKETLQECRPFHRILELWLRNIERCVLTDGCRGREVELILGGLIYGNTVATSTFQPN